jgi:hypothetical protein
MIAMPGCSAIMVNIGEPQSPQNRRSRGLPFSVPVVAWTRGEPSISSAGRGTMTLIEKAAPLWRWQSSQ